MPYVRTTWVNNSTKLNADNMNNIEEGINELIQAKGNTDIAIQDINDSITTLSGQIKTLTISGEKLTIS